MKLALTIRLDESDDNVFESAAAAGEWAISGGFEFSDWDDKMLTGKSRQAFANGWLSLESFGRATFVAIATITKNELQYLEDKLTEHLIKRYGAPSQNQARPVAREELQQMQSLCEDYEDNTVIMVSRSLTDTGIHESYRFNVAQDASLAVFAVHGSVD